MKVTSNPDGTFNCELTKPEHAKLLAARAIVHQLAYHLPTKDVRGPGHQAVQVSNGLFILATGFNPNTPPTTPPAPDAKKDG